MGRAFTTVGALLGGLMSLPLVALFFLGERVARLPFVPFDLFDWLARVLPGNLITVAIDLLVYAISLFGLGPTGLVAKRIEQGMALALAIAGGALLGTLVATGLERTNWRGWQVGWLTGLLAFLLAALIEVSLGFTASPIWSMLWMLLLFSGWGILLGHWLEADRRVASLGWEGTDRSRRRAMVQLAKGALAVTLGAWGIASLMGRTRAEGAGRPLAGISPTTTGGGGTPGTTPLPQATLVAPAGERLPPAPGTRPELTPTSSFYRIDINTRPPVVDQADWVLQVEGLFDRPRPLTLDDLMAYPATTQPLTLSCISNPIGGDLIGTSHWTGVPLPDLLDDLGLQPAATALLVEATDGFFETVEMADMMDPRTLLVYGMNGETLTEAHGFPLRIYIPNRYGMKQPKWITRIVAMDEAQPGYWVVRGWSKDARPQIVSVIDTIAREHEAEGQIPIGGIAWAGDRGIRKVELQVDGGEWMEAALRTPPLGSLTWVQWRFDWPAVPGRHTFRVRATDGTGALQIEAEQDVRPNGATGYHSRTLTI